MDLALDRAADRHQEEAEIGRHVDQPGRDLDVTVDTTALEVQRVAFPAIGDIEFLGDMVGDTLDLLLRFRHGAGMRALDFDAGHGSWSTANRRRMRPILLGFDVCTKNRDRAVC